MDKQVRAGGAVKADPSCSFHHVPLVSSGGRLQQRPEPRPRFRVTGHPSCCHRSWLSVVLEPNIGALSSGFPNFSTGANGSFLVVREWSLQCSNYPKAQ